MQTHISLGAAGTLGEGRGPDSGPPFTELGQLSLTTPSSSTPPDTTELSVPSSAVEAAGAVDLDRHVVRLRLRVGDLA